MSARRKRPRLMLMTAVALAATGLGVAAHETSLLRWLELRSIDVRFSVRGELKTPKDVAVVAVDARTFSQLGGLQWPYPRRYHARVIRTLKAAGAKVIVYDVQFTEPSSSPRDDAALYDAVAAARNVVLGTSEIGKHGSTRIFGGGGAVRAAHALAGSSQYDLDPNGVIRRMPYETDGLITMPVAAYKRAHGRLPSRAGFSPDAWIDYVGPPRAIPTVSYSDVLSRHYRPGFFRNRIVVVGASAPSLQDVHPTSTSGNDEMAGPEIQANAIYTLERGVRLRSASHWLDILLIVALGLVAPLPGLRLGAIWSGAIAVLGTGAFLVAAQLAFNSGRIITVVYPLATALIATIGVIGVHYFTEVRERQRTRTAFARFVPAAVVDRVLEHAEDGLRLGGEEVLGTVLFSDIRGFTTFSESHTAPEVIEVLNRYLTEMTEAIMEHGGTLIAYLGDGIIAIFGAPLEQADHADRALAAAQEMLGPRLEKVNRWIEERGLEPFAMGVGLNSGLLMAGNVGSQDRLEYTVIGDTVNTASRIEGLTKGSGYSLFLSESTRFMLTREAPPLDDVGEFEIRGRTTRMKLWGPAKVPDTPVPDAEAATAEST